MSNGSMTYHANGEITVPAGRLNRYAAVPEEEQARRMMKADAKRARKAKKRVRDAELTGLGREVSRAMATYRTITREFDRWPVDDSGARAWRAAIDARCALRARRARS